MNLEVGSISSIVYYGPMMCSFLEEPFGDFFLAYLTSFWRSLAMSSFDSFHCQFLPEFDLGAVYLGTSFPQTMQRLSTGTIGAVGFCLLRLMFEN